MDQNDNVRVVEEEEEEKSGWTLLSTLNDGEPSHDSSPHQETDSSNNRTTVEPLKGTEGISDPTSDSRAVEEKQTEEMTDDSDVAEEFHYAEDDDDADDELTDCGQDVENREEEFVFEDSAKGFGWEGEPCKKQTVVEHQSGQKQGLMWRASLVATLGFFGWAILSGLTGGSKGARCLKSQHCSLKEGEPVLSTL
ncbi:hypothetical protein KP509_30G059100 [Ceratopteris richardii]|uniref:Uncharacterized protein n=1 Tax=Ceratopteris richardii TaxID=49495 RepID=A0A8T2R3V8_CERRI|nr:hypothetical protein KP509_30G059100 [Ceratopteris richardii]KAH7290678.1 hypothetical protein KP509_30G059100 [Ceratopteris richardii]KAH7290679.1 hypothetical protein KP509_30G059100 [Ceratopteris richardii]